MGKLGLWEVKERAPLPPWLPSSRPAFGPQLAESKARALSTSSQLSYCGILMGQTSFHMACGEGPRKVRGGQLQSRCGSSKSWGHCRGAQSPQQKEGTTKGLLGGAPGKGGGGLPGFAHLFWCQCGRGWEPGLPSRGDPLFLPCAGKSASGPQRWCEIWQDPWTTQHGFCPQNNNMM